MNIAALFAVSATSKVLVLISFVGIALSAIIETNKFKNLITGKRIILGVSVAFTLIVIFSQNSGFAEYVTFLLGKDITFSGRYYIWMIAKNYIVESPILGNGPLIEYFPEGWAIHMTHAHNLYLDIAAKYGIVALSIALCTVVAALIPTLFDFKLKGNSVKSKTLYSKMPDLVYLLFGLFLLGSIVEVYDYMLLFTFCMLLYSFNLLVRE